MALVCKAGCNRKLNVSYDCDICLGTYHKGCSKLRKVLDVVLGNVKICKFCQEDPINIAKYDLTSASGNAKKRKKSGSSSSSFVESDEEKEEEKNENPTASDILQAIKDHKRSNKRSFNKLNLKIDGNTSAINENKQVQASNQAEIKLLSSEVSSIKATLSNEISISGHLGALDSKADLVSLAVGVFNFMGVPVSSKHIRRARLMQIKPVTRPLSEVVASNRVPPRIVVTMYSHGKFLRILDAKKVHPKILNSDVTVGSTASEQIYVNAMLNKEFYELLKKCKVWAKNNNYKFVWYSEGSILIKKDKNAPVFSVKKFQDLDNLQAVSQTEIQSSQSSTQENATLHSSQPLTNST